MKRIFLFSLVIFSCTVDKNKLYGTWQAVSFYESGQLQSAPLDSVRLELEQSGLYRFKSIGFYREEGNFRLNGNFLMLRESGSDGTEKAVRILRQWGDSLKMEMKTGDKKQVVVWARK